MPFRWIAISLVVGFFACHDEPVAPAPREDFVFVIPDGFPVPSFPDDNHFTPERWALGRKLFFDKSLSRDSTLSCASCHRPELAFSDQVPVSPGVDGRLGTRNAPSLANVVYHPYFTREGGLPTLEMQVFVPLQEQHELDLEIALAGERLAQDPTYQQMSQAAYGRPFDYYVITRALANFERSLISGQSRYDDLAYRNQSGALDPVEKAGMALFFSERTSCSNCHGGFNFTTYAFANNGLYESYADPGRFRLTQLPGDLAVFKVPSLRNVAVTAPYMHDGSLATLEDVVAHYNRGGRSHPNKSPLIRPLDLTAEEEAQLVAFLKALTDTPFLENPFFQAP